MSPQLQSSSAMPWLSYDPGLDSLRSDSRFAALVESRSRRSADDDGPLEQLLHGCVDARGREPAATRDSVGLLGRSAPNGHLSAADAFDHVEHALRGGLERVGLGTAGDPLGERGAARSFQLHLHEEARPQTVTFSPGRRTAGSS